MGEKNLTSLSVEQDLNVNSSWEARIEILRQISQKLDLSSFVDFRVYLFGLYRTAVLCIEGYSFDHFAFDLGIGNGDDVEKIILGKKTLEPQAVILISAKLFFTSQEQVYLGKLVWHQVKDGEGGNFDLINELIKLKVKNAKGLSKNQADYFSHWFIPVLGEYLGLKKAKRKLKDIARALVPQISTKEATKALETLVNTGIVDYDEENGEYVRSNRNLSTDSEVSSNTMIKYHEQMIKLGKRALRTVPAEEREVSTTTVSVSLNTAMKMKKMIQEFEDLILEEESKNSEQDRVYQMNIQFFPIAKAEGGDKDD